MRRRVSAFMVACVFASATDAAPAEAMLPRVASLNMCTDELVMLLAPEPQITSVTHLSQDLRESPLWRVARRFSANDGSMLSAAGERPTLIVTMGGIARDRERLAHAIGAEILILPFPQSLDDIEASVRQLAAALQRKRQGERIVAAMQAVRRTEPERAITGFMLSGGGFTQSSGSLGSQWMALAGIEVPPGTGPRIAAERLAYDPPEMILRSIYRPGQTALRNSWPGFRMIGGKPDIRQVVTDGRLWTCAGPLLVAEIVRLRRKVAQ